AEPGRGVRVVALAGRRKAPTPPVERREERIGLRPVQLAVRRAQEFANLRVALEHVPVRVDYRQPRRHGSSPGSLAISLSWGYTPPPSEPPKVLAPRTIGYGSSSPVDCCVVGEPTTQQITLDRPIV